MARLRLITVRLGSPREPGEGLRIGVVRFLPRGIRRRDYARLNYFDVWMPALAPSRELLRRAWKLARPGRKFFKQYRREMAQTEKRQLIELLAKLAKRTPISIGCYCEDETKCHRSVLFRLIREAALSHRR